MKKHAVIIVGGGMVGLSLAAALAEAGVDTAIVERFPPPLQWPKDSFDSRVSAIHLATQRFLKNIHIWNLLDPQSFSPIERMHVWDDVGGGIIDFECEGAGVERLGYIIENREILRVLWQHLSGNKNISFYPMQNPQELKIFDDHVELKVEDEKTRSTQLLSAALIVGADGSNSWVREQMQIQVKERPYLHQAFTAVVATEKPHAYTAYQNFLASGPLALLPLANPHHVAMVWSVTQEKANYLETLPQEDFNQELTRSIQNNLGQNHLGKLSLISELKKIPLTMRHAQSYVQERIALVGDAAHTIHPLAGQGVNLGFMDVACLAQSLLESRQKNQDLGNRRALRRYERWRKADNLIMLASMQLFQEVFSSQKPLVVKARSYGLNFTNQVKFIKNCFVRYAMGDVDDLPELAKGDKYE